MECIAVPSTTYPPKPFLSWSMDVQNMTPSVDFPPPTCWSHFSERGDEARKFLARLTRKNCILDILDEVCLGWSKQSNAKAQNKKDLLLQQQREWDAHRSDHRDSEIAHLSTIDIEKVPAELRDMWRAILHWMPMPRPTDPSIYASEATWNRARMGRMGHAASLLNRAQRLGLLDPLVQFEEAVGEEAQRIVHDSCGSSLRMG